MVFNLLKNVPELPRKFLHDFPRTSLTVDVESLLAEVPPKFQQADGQACSWAIALSYDGALCVPGLVFPFAFLVSHLY